MSFQEAIKAVLNKYAQFGGRSRRSEYWFWTLATALANIVARILDGILGVGIFQLVLFLAILIPGLAVAVRRLHDTGRSGWWLLLILIPIIGWILLIVWYCQDSQPNDNAYGPSPKAVGGFEGYGQPNIA